MIKVVNGIEIVRRDVLRVVSSNEGLCVPSVRFSKNGLVAIYMDNISEYVRNTFSCAKFVKEIGKDKLHIILSADDKDSVPVSYTKNSLVLYGDKVMDTCELLLEGVFPCQINRTLYDIDVCIEF